MNRILTLILALLLISLGILALRKSATDTEATADASPGVARQDSVRRFWELYRQATADRLAGRFEAASEGYRQAILLNGQHEDGLYYLGNVYMELSRFEEAESIWRQLVQVNPQSSRAHSRLGALYLCLDDRSRFDLEKAKQAFERAHQINREETGPILRLGEVALLQQDWPAAENYFEAVTGSNYSSVEAYFFGGFVAWKHGNMEKATEWLRLAVHYTLNTKPRDNIVGEGDTRMISEEPAPLKCPLFETPLQQLHSYDIQVLPNLAAASYRELDIYLTRRIDSTLQP